MFLSIIVDTLISVGHMYRGEVARLWGMCMLRFSKYLKTFFCVTGPIYTHPAK